MRSLERKFNNISEKKPLWSSYVCFAEAIKHHNFSEKIIKYWFNRLVDKEDYCRREKREVLKHLHDLSRVSEDGTKSTLISSRRLES